MSKLIELASFRSPEHLFWFIGAVIVLLATTVLVIDLQTRRPRRFPFAQLIWLACANFYSNVSAQAVALTNGGKYEFGQYSPDCIWFNAGVAWLYIILCIVITIHWICTLARADAERFRTSA